MSHNMRTHEGGESANTEPHMVGQLTADLPPLHVCHSSDPLTFPAAAQFLRTLPIGSSSMSGGGGVDDFDDDEEDVDSSSSSSADDDDEWGTIHGDLGFTLGSCDSDEDEPDLEGSLFIPEPVFHVSSLREKIPMPCHSEEELPFGTHVWVVDEEDVETLLHLQWDTTYETVCNGRQEGVVMRHSGAMTMVRFEDSTAGLYYTLPIPRSCLSLTQIESYDCPPRPHHHVMSSCYGNLGPRAVRVGLTSSLSPPSPRHATAMPPLDTHGNLAGANGTTERRQRCDQYYDAIDMSSSEALVSADLRAALEHLRQCNHDEALKYVNAFLQHAEAGSLQRIDALLMRSRIGVARGHFADALMDAEACIQLEPHWMRGFTSAARAMSGLGDFDGAKRMLTSALAVSKCSLDLQRVNDLNNYMRRLQRHVSTSFDAVELTLDGMYRKRLVLRPQLPTSTATSSAAAVSPIPVCAAVPTIQRSTVLCWEEIPIAALHSLLAQHPQGRCCVCYREGAEAMPDASVKTSDCASPIASGSELYCEEPAPPLICCSTECGQRASLFQASESKYRDALENVRAMLLKKATTCSNAFMYEAMHVTLRVFFMVMTTHRRLMRQQKRQQQQQQWMESACNTLQSTRQLRDTEVAAAPPIRPATAGGQGLSDIPVEAALQHLGLYPLVSYHVSAQAHEKVTCVYDILTNTFTEDDRALYSVELFSGLYHYTYTYLVPVDLQSSASGTGLSPIEASHSPLPSAAVRPSSGQRATRVLFLPALVSAVDRLSGQPCMVADALSHSHPKSAAPAGADGGEIPSKITPGMTAPIMDAAAMRQCAGPAANCVVRIVPAATAQHPALLSSALSPASVAPPAGKTTSHGSGEAAAEREKRPLLELVTLQALQPSDTLYTELLL